MKARHVLMAIAGLSIAYLLGVWQGIRQATRTTEAARASVRGTIPPRGTTPVSVSRVGPSLVEIDRRVMDQQLTDYQRQDYLQSVTGSLVSATGSILDIRGAGDYNADQIWLTCAGLSGEAKSAMVTASISRDSLPVLSSLRKGQVITVVGQFQSFKESMDRPLFGGPRYSNGHYSLGEAHVSMR